MKAEVKAMVRNIEAGSLSGMAETEGFSAPLSPLSGECDDEAVDAVDYSMVYPVFKCAMGSFFFQQGTRN